MPDWNARLNDVVANGYPEDYVFSVMDLAVLQAWEPGYVRSEVTPKAHHVTIGGSVFGGFVAAVADQVAIQVAQTRFADDEIGSTVEQRTAYFQPIRPGRLCIEGRIVHRSRKLMHCEVDFASTDGDLLARSSATTMLRTLPPA